jgi:outer membrane protein assembly factor BamB
MAKGKKLVKGLLIIFCVLVFICAVWTIFSLVGRIKTDAVIPDSAVFRVSISNPVRLFDNVLSHESLKEISSVSSLSQAVSVINILKDSPLAKNRLLRIAARGSVEAALLSEPQAYVIVWDMGFFSPLLRIFPVFSGFFNVPNLYYVQAGKNSRFEYRLKDKTFFIGPYRNLLFISDSSEVFESRAYFHAEAQLAGKRPESKQLSESKQPSNKRGFNVLKPSSFDAALLLSPDFFDGLMSDQDSAIAAVLGNVDINSAVEAGFSVQPQKIELRITASLSSRLAALNRLLEARSQAPGMAERLPASSQYATVLSAGTLDELFQATGVFAGKEFEDTIRSSDSLSRSILGVSLDDLLFSWSGKEFAVFGLEGRPHPVYAIQIADERKRQAVFDRAFKSIALNENLRLNLDGVRIPRIEVPEFLQSLLRHWDMFLPSPYYTIYRDYLLASESAEALLAALRAIQRNDVLPKTAAWRNIAGGRTAASAFSLYYSLDLSMPFFLRKNTALSGFLSLYRQGLVRMSFDKGQTDISLVLVPGSGRGVNLVNSLLVETKTRPHNRIYGSADNSRIFISAGDTVISVNTADNSVNEMRGADRLWIIPAEGVGDKNGVNAWVISERGRVTLVNDDLEPAQGFPALTGLRLSSAPVAYNGKLYLCDEEGKVHTVDANGAQKTWETSFTVSLRSPPSFMMVQAKTGTRHYAAVYPKSFFGELWLLDTEGKLLPEWPAQLMGIDKDGFVVNAGISFGSPFLFALNDNVHTAFVSQSGDLFVFDEGAKAVSPFPVALNGVFYVQPVFDGNFFWLVSAEGNLFRVSQEGEVLYQSIAGFSAKEEGYITVFDCDGDKIPEVFFTGEGNALYAYTQNFRSLEGFPLPAWGRPHFVPAQGSKKAEIYGIGMDRRLYRWQFR